MQMHESPGSTDRQLLYFWQEQLRQARERPWLAAHILRRWQAAAAKVQMYYEQLLALPPRWRRALSRRFSLGLAGAALMLALSGAGAAAPRALAAPQKVIVVDEVNGMVGCKLTDAIESANTGSAPSGSGCEDGDAGLDTIEIQADVNLSSPMTYISSDITINANGHTIDGGGAAGSILVISSGDVTINDATITGGSSLVQGGGIDAYGTGTLIVDDSVITGNSSPFGSGIFGGENQTVKIYDSTISGNTFSGVGSSYGGGVFALGPTTVERSTISGNEADYGGGLRSEDNVLTVNSSTFSANNAVYGGGLDVYGATAVITNSTISGNMAALGAGLRSYNANVTLTNATVTGNEATTPAAPVGGSNTIDPDAAPSSTAAPGSEAALDAGFGGGISVACYSDINDTVTLQRSVISGNSANRGSEIDAYGCAYNIKAGSYNIIGHNDASYTYYFEPYGSDYVPQGAASTVLDPNLQDNGGPTFTHNPAAGSPAIDFVPNDQSPATDQRGAPRPYNDPTVPPPTNAAAPQDEEPLPPVSADSGAVEYGAAVPSAITIESFSAAAGDVPALPAIASGGLLAATLVLWHRMRRRGAAA